MRWADGMRLCSLALLERPLRSVLSLLGVAIGIAAVVVLSAIGEGLRGRVPGARLGRIVHHNASRSAISPGCHRRTRVPCARTQFGCRVAARCHKPLISSKRCGPGTTATMDRSLLRRV